MRGEAEAGCIAQVKRSQEVVAISNVGEGAARWALRAAPPGDDAAGSPQALPDWLAACPAGGMLAAQVGAKHF